MNYDLWINISNYIIAFGVILTALGGFGSFRFNKLKEQIKNNENEKQRVELNARIDSLLSNQDKLSNQLDPFVEYAKELYPNKNIEEALEQLKKDLENQNIKIKDLESDLGDAKEEIHKPAKLAYVKHEILNEKDKVKILVVLKPNKHVQLGELEFTVTIADMNDNSQILDIATDPGYGNYYIMGPYYNKFSTNKKQAKLKYSPAGYVENPNISILLNKKTDLIIEGSHELTPIEIKVK